MILNTSQLTEIKDLFDENFSALLEVFLHDSALYVEKICAWKSDAEHSSVIMAAHTLKSTSANLGLDELAWQCTLIEAACSDQQHEQITELVSSIGQVYQQSITALQQAVG